MNKQPLLDIMKDDIDRIVDENVRQVREESDARLMIKEGSFKEYVNMWIAHFPQRKLISQIKELHSKYGLGLFDARMVARVKGADEDVILEVGDNVLLRKMRILFL